MNSEYRELLAKLLNDDVTDVVPQSRAEYILLTAINNLGINTLPEPGSRMEAYLMALITKMSDGGSSENTNYTLPIASDETLGGVMPVTKTAIMSQEVGVDEEGKLFTTPGGGAVTNNNTVNQYFYNNCVTGKYDLKDGYSYTPDVYIAADGTETARTGLNFSCIDYIPVEQGIGYTCCAIGYALYDADKNFLSADVNIQNYGEIREFAPEVDGYVRLTIRGNLDFARFCKTADVDKCLADYLPERSPFSNPTIPCDVQLYGDSNSYGYRLSDTAKSWANRLGSLITSMPEEIKNCPDKMAVFSGEYSKSPKLMTYGRIRMSAYTNKFVVDGLYVGTVKVLIDDVEVAAMTTSPVTYEVDLGYHTIELRGSSGQNVINGITTARPRNFTNNAVIGKNSSFLPADPPNGNIALVMFGTNDRELMYGETAFWFSRFVRQCHAVGTKVYLFSPIPTLVDGEVDESYKKTISEVINEIPNVNYIDVYKDMQMFSLLSSEPLYKDNLHLNDYGHKVLFAIAASSLHLAALNSVFEE